MKPSILRILLLLAFGLAMGYLEGVVVVYLKALLPQQPAHISSRDVILSLGLLAFIGRNVIQDVRLVVIEQSREAATIVMLLAIALLSSQNLKGRIAAFFFTFSVWDITYYGTLHFWLGWPTSLWDLDVYFLLPVPWVGPIVTPIAVSAIVGLFSARVLLRTE